MRALNIFTKERVSPRNVILWFSYPVFFIFLADSTLSYMFPIAVENIVNSNTVMGLILALSSGLGLLCDFLFPQIFKKRTWRFYLITGILISMLFPIFLSLGTSYVFIPFFLVASLSWGIYFEMLMFSEQTFVVKEESKNNYSKDWGLLFFLYELTTVMGPIIGAVLLKELLFTSTLTLLFIQFISFIFALVLVLKIPYKEKLEVRSKSRIKETINILREAKYWELLSFRVWPVIILGTSVTFISATFWTIGGLLGQRLNVGYEMDWIVIVLYGLPLMMGSFILSRLGIKKYKKRISQISLLLSSILLSLFIFFKDNTTLLLINIFLSSFFLSFANPLNEAVYSDLLERMGKGREYLLGLSKSNTSLAYVLAPIIVGFLSDKTDYFTTFSIVGVIFIIVSSLLLIFTPRKLKLPQKKLETL